MSKQLSIFASMKRSREIASFHAMTTTSVTSSDSTPTTTPPASTIMTTDAAFSMRSTTVTTAAATGPRPGPSTTTLAANTGRATPGPGPARTTTTVVLLDDDLTSDSSDSPTHRSQDNDKGPTPAKIIKKTPAKKQSKRVRDAEYDKNTRNRKFLASWAVGRPWLVHDPVKNVLLCSICRDNRYGMADDKGPWAKEGSKTFQVQSINKHRDSVKHKREADAHDAAKTPAADRIADRMLMRMNQDRLDRLCIKFRNVHALSKHNRPFTDFVWLNRLDRAKGLDVGHDKPRTSQQGHSLTTLERLVFYVTNSVGQSF